MTWQLLPPLLLALVVIVVVARLMGLVARRVGQPAVIGEILGGLLLGPTLLGGTLSRAVIVPEVRPTLALLANVGVAVFMFLVGLELDPRVLRGQQRIAAAVSLTTIVVPFGLGAVLALYLLGHQPVANPQAFVLFVGTAMAITAFPVLARILTDRGLLHTPIGGLALACAAVDDVLAWALLAVVVALSDTAAQPWQLLLVIPFVLLVLLVVRPLLARAARWAAQLPAERPALRGTVSAGLALLAAAGLWACATTTDRLGLHLIFGAFLFGVVLPRDPGLLSERLLGGVRRISGVLLLPIFFVVAGISVDLSSLDGTALGDLGLILVVAIAGKAIGAFVAARLSGARTRHSAVLAILLNTRGLTELVVLTVGLQLGVLDTRMYSLMVVMALVTTAMAGLLLPWVYPQRLVAQDSRPPEVPTRSEVV